MSDTNGVTSAEEYKARTRPLFTCSSGARFRVKRPGPEVSIKAQRLPASLRAKMQQVADGEATAQKGVRLIQEMSDEEFGRWMLYARSVVEAVVVEPRIVAGEAGEGELSAADLEETDFWELFEWGTMGGRVKVMGGEVSYEDLRSFRLLAGISQRGDSGETRGDADESLPAN